jgi:hypothetical protein
MKKIMPKHYRFVIFTLLPPRHLQGFLKRPKRREQGFLFPLSIAAGDEFAGSAARRAEFQDLAANPAQRMNARVTKALLALGAAAPGANFRMVQTGHGAVGQQSGRSWLWGKLWNRDHNGSGFQDHCHLA